MNKERRYQIRLMRKSPTDMEKTLWGLLRSRQFKDFKFRRQHPIGPYIVDFCCLEKRLVVEIDGAHHLTQKEADQKRSNFLGEQGFSVLRFWNSQIQQDPGAVLGRLVAVLGDINRRISPAKAKMYKWVSPLPIEGEGQGEGGHG